MLDLVTHDDARPALSAAHLAGRTALTYAELAELAGEYQHGLQRGSSQPAGEIYIETALLLATSGSAGSPKTAMRR